MHGLFTFIYYHGQMVGTYTQSAILFLYRQNEIWGNLISGLSVSKNFNIDHNFWTIRDKLYVWHVHFSNKTL